MKVQRLIDAYNDVEAHYFENCISTRRSAAGDAGEPARDVRLAAKQAVDAAVQAMRDPAASWFSRWKKVRAAKRSLIAFHYTL